MQCIPEVEVFLLFSESYWPYCKHTVSEEDKPDVRFDFYLYLQGPIHVRVGFSDPNGL